MPSSSNKLVDKYQYNQNNIKVDGSVQLITAKHIVLKQYYTLKKICINNPNSLFKYQGIINEMNILKILPNFINQPSALIKCHKMLKTSNNLYVVFDLIGKNPDLEEYLSKNQEISQNKSIFFFLIQKEKTLATHIFNFIKDLHSNKLFFLNLNPSIIEIDNSQNIKFINFQGIISSTKNISSYVFKNIQITNYVSPQLRQFVESVQFPYQKQIDFNLFSQRLDKAHTFSFGKVLADIYKKQIQFVKGTKIYETQQLPDEFEYRITQLIQNMVSINPERRPDFEQIQAKLFPVVSQQKKPKIKISRFINTLQITKSTNLEFQTCKSPRVLDKSKNTITSQFLSPPNDQFDKKSEKSIKSSGQFSNSHTYSVRVKKRKSSFHNVDSDESSDQVYKAIVLKAMKRRSLCKFLLKLAGIIFSLQMIDKSYRMMLSFMLIKKSVLLICSLARYISTGKGQSDQFDFKDSIRKEFAKTNDFFKLSVSINKQMDLARNLYVSLMNQINNEFPQINQIKQFAFSYECKSQNLNQKYMKNIIKKSAIQILKKICGGTKPITNSRKPSYNLQLSQSRSPQKPYLTTSVKPSKSKMLQVQDITLTVRSAKSVQSNLSGGSSVTQNRLNFDNENIKRNISQQNFIYIYLMVMILDYETFQNFFNNCYTAQQKNIQQQLFYIKIKKMEVKDIATLIFDKVY